MGNIKTRSLAKTDYLKQLAKITPAENSALAGLLAENPPPDLPRQFAGFALLTAACNTGRQLPCNYAKPGPLASATPCN